MIAEAVAARRGVRLLAGVDPEALAAVASRVDRRFRGLPFGALFGIDPGRIAAQLTPLEGCGTSLLEVRAHPARVRWELCPPRPENPAAR